ncbi:MAG: hypothetical protein JWM80_2101 [Cyanobacteria bacterium RYN_339]|nr:hypothetical protein [Cyanobacteria bacterium RYN_339]
MAHLPAMHFETNAIGEIGPIAANAVGVTISEGLATFRVTRAA